MRAVVLKAIGASLIATIVVGCGQAPNQAGSPSGTLCYDYFQRCVYPLALDAVLAVDRDNDGVFDDTRSCSDSACHAQTGVTGGALRLTPGEAIVDLSSATVAQVRASPMYDNFVHAMGRTDLNNPRQSNLLRKPLLEITHGGGRVFVTDQDAAAQQILFWATNRVTGTADEFAASCANLFLPGQQCQVLP